MKTRGKKPPRVVIAAGGTGGHLFPALALAVALRARGARPLVAGRAGYAIRREFARCGIAFRTVPAARLPARAAALPGFCLDAAGALAAALRLAAHPRPAAVVGMGGYASAAPAGAALALGVPVYFCEQNLLPGRVTRLFARRVQAVFTFFPESARYLPGARVLPWGNPVRPFGPAENQADCRRRLGLDPGRFTVVVLGGSQGAHRLNLLVVEALAGLDPRAVQFIHLAGPGDYPAVTEAYRRAGFLAFTAPFHPAMGGLYGAGDLALCRAGATTIAELALFGLPAILVPFPHAAEDHQKMNAACLEAKGAAVMREQAGLTGGRLAADIADLTADRLKRAEMSRAALALAAPAAADRIAAYLISSASEKTSARKV